MIDLQEAVLRRFLAMSQAVAGQMDYQSVLTRVAEELGELIPHDHADIALLVNEGRDHVAYEVGVHTAWSDLARTPLPVELSPIRTLFRAEVPYLFTDDALNDDRFHFAGALDGPIFDARLRSRIHVPLRVQGETIGVLSLSRHIPNAYDDRALALAQHVGDLLASYLYSLVRGEEAHTAALAEGAARAREELLRVGALRLTEGMERERQRLAMDLHDQTLADLSRLIRHVKRLRGGASVGDADLEAIQSELDSCLNELRGIIEDAKPGVLQLFGFAEAVDALLRRSVQEACPGVGTAVHDATAALPDRLGEPVRTALYRIVQEAVNNAVRHAGAGRIEVNIEQHGGCLEVSVEDDGKGIGGNEASANGGLGHMRTRAALINARFHLAPGSGGVGTRVGVSLPLVAPLQVPEAGVPTPDGAAA